MNRKYFKIEGIPCILWGDKSEHLFLSVHGNLSNKEDTTVALFAEKAVQHGYQVLSFDLPAHGDRKDDTMPCKGQYCISNLKTIMAYAKSFYKHISLMGFNMGAYFSLLAYEKETFEQVLFLAPITDMQKNIENIMNQFHISEEDLKEKQVINTPIGETLYWDYYSYIKSHPILNWNKPTSILYGSDDSICEFDTISSFVRRFGCDLQIMEHGEHYFHTDKQLKYYKDWIDEKIFTVYENK